MAVRQLDRIKFAFLQKYSNSDLYTLIFTDYKKYPTELTKVADLEIVAKAKIAQVTDILGITRFTTLLDVFESVQQLREQALVAVVDTEAPPVDDVGAISEADISAGYDAGGGGGG
jgi:hypothetical protein